MDEVTLAAFEDELEKIGFVGALGAGVRGGVAAAKGVGKKLWEGKSVGGVGGAWKSISGRASQQAKQHGALSQGLKPVAGGGAGPMQQLSARGAKRGKAIASRNNLVGGAALATPAVAGVGYGVSRRGGR